MAPSSEYARDEQHERGQRETAQDGGRFQANALLHISVHFRAVSPLIVTKTFTLCFHKS
jgi:hypothetical protein